MKTLFVISFWFQRLYIVPFTRVNRFLFQANVVIGRAFADSRVSRLSGVMLFPGVLRIIAWLVFVSDSTTRLTCLKKIFILGIYRYAADQRHSVEAQ